MFQELKDKYWGREIFAVDLPSNTLGPSLKVFVWKKGAKHFVSIRSTWYAFSEGVGGSDATVKFHESDVPSLVDALVEARSFVMKIVGKGL